MRWADIDQQAHVNNVTYADYLREARIAAVSETGESLGGERVLRLEVDYRAPVVFRPEPLLVETSWSGDGVVEQELVDLREDGGRTVFLRARTTLADVPETLPRIPPSPGRTTSAPMRIRVRDLGPDGVVDPVAMLELFQEGRVAFITIATGRRVHPWVVARNETTFLRPAPYRAEPYVVRNGVGRVGHSSYEVRAELIDEMPTDGGGPVVVATSRAVMVAFDPVAQRSREISEHVRAQLAEYVAL